MVWDVWGGALGGTFPDHEKAKSVPMQRGARPVLRRSAPMQRGARFSLLRVPLGGATWAQ